MSSEGPVAKGPSRWLLRRSTKSRIHKRRHRDPADIACRLMYTRPKANVATGRRAIAREALMATYDGSIRIALLAGSMFACTLPAQATEVTPQRLLNPDKEPQNWLMNHRTYDGQRYSPLARISRDNVKNLKLAYAVPLGGSAGNEFTNATPLAEDGFIYVTDSWGVLYKIDATAGDVGRIVWRMDPSRSANCATAAPPCGAISSSPGPESHRRGSSPPTRTPARWCGRPRSRIRPM